MLSSAIEGENNNNDNKNEAPLFLEDEELNEAEKSIEAEINSSATEANKENLPPLKFSTQKKRLGKHELKKALIESEKLKKSTFIAPPVPFPRTDLSSVSAFLQKQKTAQAAKREKKNTTVDVRSKPWAKHLSQEELGRILAKMPKLSHDDSATKGDNLIIIKTLQCGRSDATKERIKAGILPKPTRNNLLELNRKLETKIKEQSSEAWKERINQLGRPKKIAEYADEEYLEQVTDEEEANSIPKPDRNEIAQELLMPTVESPNACYEQTKNEKRDSTEELLDSLLDEATQNVESKIVQRQQKSIMGFLSKEAPIPDIPLFYHQESNKNDEKDEGSVSVRELMKKNKIKNYFFDEEAQTDDSSSNGEDDEKKVEKKKKRRKGSDDESIDEAEIERELKASKFLVDESDGEQNEDQIRATHTKLQLEADRAQIEKLAKKFNISSESDYDEEQDDVNQEDATAKDSIWAGKTFSSDLRMDEDQLTDSMSEESIVRSEPEVDEGDKFQSSLRTEHRTALDDLLKISSVIDIPQSRNRSKPARSRLPSSRTLIPEKRGNKFEN